MKVESAYALKRTTHPNSNHSSCVWIELLQSNEIRANKNA